MIALLPNFQQIQKNCYSSASTSKEIHSHIQKVLSIEQISNGDCIFNVEQCMKNPNLLLELECSICSKIMADPVELTCKHTFCFECAQKCLSQYRSCPLCRKKCRRQKGQFQLKRQSPSLRTIKNKIKSITFYCSECRWVGKSTQFIQKFGQSPCIDIHDWFQTPIKIQLKRQQTKTQEIDISLKSQKEPQKKCEIKCEKKIYEKYNSQSLLLNNSKFDNQNIFIEDKVQKSRRQYEFLQSDIFKQYFRLNYYL